MVVQFRVSNCNCIGARKSVLDIFYVRGVFQSVLCTRAEYFMVQEPAPKIWFFFRLYAWNLFVTEGNATWDATWEEATLNSSAEDVPGNRKAQCNSAGAFRSAQDVSPR